MASISIHAPARGATPRLLFPDAIHLYFNPRSREGSDALRLEHVIATPAFQSTLPRGERRGGYAGIIDRQLDFNPRSREGSDQTQLLL